MRVIQLLAFLTYFLMATSNPFRPAIQPRKDSETFFKSLSQTEQATLMEMIVNDAKRGASQSSSGAFIEEVNLVLPERILRRVQETKDVDFKNDLVSWIGHQWALSDQAIVELQSKGRGCNPRICLSITNRSSSDTCCPFG